MEEFWKKKKIYYAMSYLHTTKIKERKYLFSKLMMIKGKQKLKIQLNDQDRIKFKQMKFSLDAFQNLLSLDLNLTRCNMCNKDLYKITNFLRDHKSLKSISCNLTWNKFTLKEVCRFIMVIKKKYFHDQVIEMAYQSKLYHLKYGNILISFIHDSFEIPIIPSKLNLSLILRYPDDYISFERKILNQVLQQRNHIKLNFYSEQNHSSLLISCYNINQKHVDLNLYLTQEQLKLFPFENYDHLEVNKRFKKSCPYIIELLNTYSMLFSWKIDYFYWNQQPDKFQYHQKSQRLLKQERKRISPFSTFPYLLLKTKERILIKCKSPENLTFLRNIILPFFLNKEYCHIPFYIQFRLNKIQVFQIQNQEQFQIYSKIFNEEYDYDSGKHLRVIVDLNNVQYLKSLIFLIFQLMNRNNNIYYRLFLSLNSPVLNIIEDCLQKIRVQFQKILIFIDIDGDISTPFLKNIQGVKEIALMDANNNYYQSIQFLNKNSKFLIKNKSLNLKMYCKVDLMQFQRLIDFSEYNIAKLNSNVIKHFRNNLTVVTLNKQNSLNILKKMERLVTIQQQQKNIYDNGEIAFLFTYNQYSHGNTHYFYDRSHRFDKKIECKYKFCIDENECVCQEVINAYESIDFHDNIDCSITRPNLCSCNNRSLQKQIAKIHKLRRLIGEIESTSQQEIEW